MFRDAPIVEELRAEVPCTIFANEVTPTAGVGVRNCAAMALRFPQRFGYPRPQYVDDFMGRKVRQILFVLVHVVRRLRRPFPDPALDSGELRALHVRREKVW